MASFTMETMLKREELTQGEMAILGAEGASTGGKECPMQPGEQTKMVQMKRITGMKNV